jgi:hypothetical protein
MKQSTAHPAAGRGLPAVPPRQPPARPRDPHGRGHPDPLPARQGPCLLRQETGRRQNRQRSAARAQTPDQRRHLRLPARRRPARRSQEPGRATGGPLCDQGGRLTPRPPALRASHSRACHLPYDPRGSLSRAAAISCERAAGSRTGRSPAAQRRPQGVLDAAAREPIIPAAGKEERSPLTLKQRGVRSGRCPRVVACLHRRSRTREFWQDCGHAWQQPAVRDAVCHEGVPGQHAVVDRSCAAAYLRRVGARPPIWRPEHLGCHYGQVAAWGCARQRHGGCVERISRLHHWKRRLLQ